MRAIREELGRLGTVEERHRRLAARIVLVVAATLLVDLLCAVGFFFAERGAPQSQTVTFGQALFFTTTQLLTVSSSLKNPLTPLGKAIDVVLETWAVLVVAGSAGAIAAFFQAGD